MSDPIADHLADLRSMDHRTRIYCQTCTDIGQRGYCAPAGCYCGHEACYAFASYVPRKAINATIKPRDNRMADAWTDREEGSWIDGL